MNKNLLLNQWLWKWHVIAGLLTLPIVLLLTLTGIVYMYKQNVNEYLYQEQMFVSNTDGQRLSLEQQLRLALNYNDKKINGLVLPELNSETTAFKVAGKGRAANLIYVDPYTGDVKGTFEQKQTFMYDIRKLHGELLLSKPGTLIVELVASWFIVLLLTGLYVWWPNEKGGVKGFFLIRVGKGRRAFWRDLHAVLGFWLSIFLLIVIAGGMPWTDVFGSQLKWVQKHTETGYPKYWRSNKGLASTFEQKSIEQRMRLDDLVTLPVVSNLKGKITIQLPNSERGVYTISNRTFYLEDQQVLHFDQYSGEVIKRLTWDDVGILMDLRQVFMRLHQGQYGAFNWYALLLVSILFVISTVAGLVSYLRRKPAGQWAIPRVPKRFQIDKLLVGLIVILSLVFPMFGISLVIISLVTWFKGVSWRSANAESCN